MSIYSPQAEDLLNQWICLSQNMRSAIARARYLQERAEDQNLEPELLHQLQNRRVNALYRDIGREMREMMSGEGIQKEFREDEPDVFMRRFIDFRISEEAIPEMQKRLVRLNELVLKLLITLCTVQIRDE